MEKTKKTFPVVPVALLGIFVLTAVLSYYCVWTHDDYMTNYGTIGSLWKTALYFGNGRYLGNFLVDFCLSHKALDVVTRSAVITGIIALLAAVPAKLSLRTLSFSFALFFGFGNFILREAFFWGHGFYNYVPPVFLGLLALAILKGYYIQGNVRHRTLKIVFLAILGFSQQFFAENFTCVILLISIAMFVLVVRKKQPKGMMLAYLIGACAGAIVMFALPEIMQVTHKMIEYRGRGLGADSLTEFIAQFIEHLRECFNALVPMFPVWTALSYGLLRITKSYSGASACLRRAKPLFYAVFVLQPLCSVVYFFISERKFKERIPLTDLHIPDLTEKIYSVFFIVLFLYLLVAAFALLRNEQLKVSRGFCGGLILLCLASVGELLIITVMGPRCLFLTACILSVLLIHLYDREALLGPGTTVCASVCGVAFSVVLIFFMRSVSRVNNVKMTYAQRQLDEGKTVIELIRLPHREWLTSPDETYANGYFFNNGQVKPADDYVFITYEEYLQTHPSE